MYEPELETLRSYLKRLEELRDCLDVETLKENIARLEDEMGSPGFWDDNEKAQGVMKQLSGFKGTVSLPDEVHADIEDAVALVELGQEAADEDMAAEIKNTIIGVEAKLQRLEMNSLFNDPRDQKDVLLSIHPGAGGTESCDWADMLYRMYLRFCEQHGFATEILDYQPGDEAGLKGATISIRGPYAYGTLKSENGVHRLVRISPFDSAARRHTSFVGVEVLSEIDDSIEIDIREEDIKMDVFRSSGAGGQKVNKTSSAVRLTHQPSGIVVSCQTERSQHRNRDTCMQMLRAKLYDIEVRKKEEELAQARGGQLSAAWGSQIRSYVLAPYQMIKDHRTSAETGNVQKVLDGDIDLFIESYLKWQLGNRAKVDAA